MTSGSSPWTSPRIKRRAVAVLAALVLPLTALVALAGEARAAEATATYEKTADWGTGFEARWTVTNTGSTPINNWTLEWDFPSGTTVSSFWDARITSSGGHHTAKDAGWNATIAPGATISFGFVGKGSGNPTGCTVDGSACDGSGGPGEPQDPTDPTDPTDPSEPQDPEEPGDPGDPGTGPGAHKNIGYFTEWGVYQRNYHVKNLVTSGSAAKLTHINYAFGNVQNGTCTIGDAEAAYSKFYSAEQSVSGTADSWDNGALRGNFNQLRQLKKLYPHLKVVWSFGGWTSSGGFGQAAQNPAAFAKSCNELVNDPRWADVFDGIDIDWEYPNACGATCDTSGADAFKNLMSALRTEFGPDQLVTAAITADASDGGKIDAADYAGAARYVDWYMPMTYDFFGAWAGQGPTAPHSPLHSYDGIPQQGFHSAAAIQKLKAAGVPSSKLLLGIGFYGRGWTGVTQSAPGGSATGPAPGTYEQGVEDYKVLKDRCPAGGTVAGTAYAHCGNQWWSYDTPSTIGGKMSYTRQQGLAGAFFWELSGDTANGELISAIHNGLS